MITKILCPLDLSDFSKRAFEHAIALGRWYHADVVALHVFATWTPPGSLSTYPGWMQQVAEARAQIDDELRGLVQLAQASGMDVPLATREGDPVSGILEQAASMAADLIVLSTHGRSGFDRLTLGSVAEKVLRKATCPVLVVPAQGATATHPFAGYRRIICAIDFSDCSRQGLAYALSLAGHAGAGLTLVHVVEAVAGPEVVDDRAPFAALRRVQVETAQGLLRSIAREHEGRGRAIDDVVRPGIPHREILGIAREIDADLVVLGVRGRGQVDLTLFGSTTNQVVRRAPCAVLTVRAN